MPIDPETGRYLTPLEAGPILGNLRSILKTYIHEGTTEELVGLLERMPQIDVYARSLYLLTFSGAVDLLTGRTPLRGLDMVVMDRTNRMWEFYGTNFGKPERYFAKLPFGRHLAQRLDQSTAEVIIRFNQKRYYVNVINPLIMLQLRLAGLFYPEMQPNEIADTFLLIKYLEQKQINPYETTERSILWSYLSPQQKNLIIRRLHARTKLEVRLK